MQKQEYTFKGDITSFGKVIYRNWSGNTFAVSTAKAATNLAYQYKKANGLAPNTDIKLVGKLTAVI